MKQITLLSAAALLALGACQRSPAEKQAENIEERAEQRAEQTQEMAEQRAEQVEQRAEQFEQQAEAIKEQGEQRAEAIEERGEKRAEQVEELGERREELREQREEARPGGPGGVAAPGMQDRWSDESQRNVVEQIRKDLVQDEQLSMVARNVVIEADQNRIVLRGFVPSERERQMVVDKAKEQAGNLPVVDELKVSALPPAE